MLKKILTIIVTYNGSTWIEKTLNSLHLSSYPTDVIVIDNCSIDQTVPLIKSNHQNLRVVENANNLGFGNANNIGLKYAIDQAYDFVFLLNQDAWVVEDTLRGLVNASNANPEYGILSPVHSNGIGDRLDLNFAFYITEQKCPYLYSHLLMGIERNEIYPLNFVNAAAWLITANCLKTIGGFDPLFYHYGEDNNYTQRVLYHGFKIGICPGTKIFHDRPQHTSGVSQTVTLNRFDREMKILVADVNNADVNLVYKKELAKLKKVMYSNLFKLRWSKYVMTYSFLRHLRTIRPLLERSYIENRKIGLTHLN